MKWLSLPLLAIMLLSLPPLLESVRLKCPPRLLKGGRVRTRSKGRVIKYVCSRGYQVLGNKYSTCIRGQWDSPAPICIRGGCESVDVLNGQVLETYRGAFVTVHCDPGYQLVGTRSLYCNGATWNDTVPFCKEINVTAQKWCDFESEDLCGWAHDLNHDFDWRRHNFATPSGHVGTGPSFDHTLGPGLNGHYLYLETSSPRLENDTARLFSPVFPAPSSPNTCFIFWYHMYGFTTGSLKVYLHHHDSVLLFSQSGDKGNQWQQAVLPLPSLDSSFQIVIEGVRGSSYEGDTAIDDVKLGEGDECVMTTAATTNTAQISSSEASDRASCEGRCLQVTSDPDLCECTADCINNNTCCPDFLIKCSPPFVGPVLVTTKGYGQQVSEDQRTSLPTNVQIKVPTTTPTTTKILEKTTATSILPPVIYTTNFPSSKTNTLSTIKPSVERNLVTTAFQTSEYPNQKNSVFTIKNDNKTLTTLQPSKKIPVTIRTPTTSTTMFYKPLPTINSTISTVKTSSIPFKTTLLLTIPTPSTIKNSTSNTPATKPRVVFVAPTVKPWVPRVSVSIRKIEFVTPPPPIVFRSPVKTTPFSKPVKFTSNQNSSINRFMSVSSTPNPKLWKNPTKEPSKSRNDVLHPSWRKDSMLPPPPPPPMLGPMPSFRTQKTTKSPLQVKITKNKLHANYLADQPSNALETKWKSKYKPKEEEPVHAHFSTISSSNEMVHVLVIVVGVLLLLTSVLATVCVVRRRKINRRNIEEDELDIRLVAPDEILDFTLARPSMDEPLMHETSR